MTKIHQSCIMSAPTTSQYAAIVALRTCDDEIEKMRDEYNRRRRYIVKALTTWADLLEPKGAFYVFPDIRRSGLSSAEFCERLLKEEEVAIIPGDAFGACGEGYARISYAYSVDHLETAVHRIHRFPRNPRLAARGGRKQVTNISYNKKGPNTNSHPVMTADTRRRLALFGGFTLVFLAALAILYHREQNDAILIVCMFSPSLSAVLTRLLTKEGIKDLFLARIFAGICAGMLLPGWRCR